MFGVVNGVIVTSFVRADHVILEFLAGLLVLLVRRRVVTLLRRHILNRRFRVLVHRSSFRSCQPRAWPCQACGAFQARRDVNGPGLFCELPHRPGHCAQSPNGRHDKSNLTP